MRGFPFRETAIGAVRRVWPGAFRIERSPEQLQQLADDLTQAVIAGRSGPIDTLFREIDSPPPVLRWAPDDASLAHRPLRFLNRYWRDQRGDCCPPPSRIIDPLDLGPALGYLMLLEPLHGGTDFLYRLYGTVVAEYAGIEMTGKRVWEVPAPLVAAYFVATYRAVLAERRPLFAHHATHHDIQIAQWDRLILPFTGDDGRVDRLLVGNVPSLREGV